MAKNSGYARSIFFSLVISIIILLAIGFLSVNYLVPLYDIQSQDIYKFMIYLLPIIIGAAFIEIGTMISSKEKSNDLDPYDQLPRNSYDNPLYADVNDDPLNTNLVSQADTQFVPLHEEKVDVAPSVEESFNTIATPANEIKPESELPVSLQQRLLALNNDEAEMALSYLESSTTYCNSVLEESTAQKLLGLTEKEANKLLFLLSEESNVVEADAVELPFDEHTASAIMNFTEEQAKDAVEYILNGPKTEFIPVKYSGEFDGSVNAVLQTEIKNAKEFEYEVSLVLMNVENKEDPEELQMLLDNVSSACFNFTKEDGSVYLIFPLYNESEAHAVLKKAFNNINHTFKYGLTSLNERYDVEVPTLMNEALDNYNNVN